MNVLHTDYGWQEQIGSSHGLAATHAQLLQIHTAVPPAHSDLSLGIWLAISLTHTSPSQLTKPDPIGLD